MISLVCRNVIRNSWILLIGEVLIDWSPAIEDSHAVPIEVVSFTAETCVNDTIESNSGRVPTRFNFVDTAKCEAWIGIVESVRSNKHAIDAPNFKSLGQRPLLRDSRFQSPIGLVANKDRG
ncbi:hypothetical protein CJO69_28655 [Burkholderia ubonensis]|nr:hypothetical protein CJO69_28655 [Burkholderia ubonensis]